MISVIIPTLNAERSLGPCLGALGPAILEPLLSEVILADGGSTDATEEIAEATGANFITAQGGRGAQLRAAAEGARAEWMLFLNPETVLSNDWIDAARTHMRGSVDKAGCFRLRFDATGAAPTLFARLANRRAARGWPSGDQGLLIHRKLYRTIGGYPDTSALADITLARALGRRRIVLLDGHAHVSADRYKKNGWITESARNFAALTRHRMGARP